MANRRLVGSLLLALFALSGLSGLIYQSVWSHYLGLTLGHAAYAQTLVLAIFMGGMALGAWFASRGTQRWKHMLIAYAVIEGIIGACGLFFHELFEIYTAFSQGVVLPAISGSFGAHAWQWFTATLLILPQSILLGMTFPLMCAGCMRIAPEDDGRILGGLYFTNSLGAAIGALVATFVLLPAIGMPGAMRVAGLVNLAVFAGAWLLASRVVEADVAPAAETSGEPAKRSDDELRFQRMMLVASFITGASSFVYEIGWVRMLNLALGATVHSFELMLAAFILGLALGGAWVRRNGARVADSVKAAGVAQVLMGIAALLSLVVFTRAFVWIEWLIKALSRNDNGYVLFALGSAGLSMLVMLPAAFFAGMTLPLFTMSLLRNRYGESSIGRIYAANTLGAIVGVFFTVHVLIPLVGVRLAVIVAGLVDIGLGLVLLRFYAANWRPVLYACLAVASAVVALGTVRWSRVDPSVLASGVYRYGNSTLSTGSKVVYYRDGKTATIAASQVPPNAVQIMTNGKTDASINLDPNTPASVDEPTMILAAALPLAMHPAPKDIGVIGFGSGLTTHTLLGSAAPQKVDTIEIEPAIYEGARAFGRSVERAYTDPRSHLVVDDARTYFAAGGRSYDVIVSEPSNPWVSGVASLFTEEFYGFATRHLNKGGLFVQWLQLYEIDDELVATMMAALHKEFPYTDAYLTNNVDLLLVASHEPLPPVRAERVLQGALGNELRRSGLGSQAEFDLRHVASRPVLDAYVRLMDVKPHSDYYPVVALKGPKARFRNDSPRLLHELAGLGGLPLDVLGARQPVAVNAQVAEDNAASPLVKGIRVARAIRRSLSSGAIDAELADRFPGLGSAVAFVRSPQFCAQETQKQALAALDEIASYSLGLFSAQDSVGLWIDPVWTSCVRSGSAVDLVLRTFAAAAHRDGAAMRETAAAALGAVPEAGGTLVDLRQRLLDIAMLGEIARGRLAEVSATDSSLGSTVRVQGVLGEIRIFLLAYADVPPPSVQQTKAD